MTTTDKKYDVAISFLFQDEGIALKLETSLSPFLKVFLFSKKQEELAGTDGLESFRDTFLTDSRIVVVLFRDGWGQTPWTRIEQAAITDRFLEDGWDWLVFVTMDNTSAPPKWLPKSKIRMSLPQYGLEQCIGAIKLRAEELGSEIRASSAVDDAIRVQKKLEFETDRKNKLSSERGVADAKQEYDRLIALLGKTFTEIKLTIPKLSFEFASGNNVFVVRKPNASLTLHWVGRYSNILDETKVVLRTWQCQMMLPNQQGFYFEQPKPVNTVNILPDYSLEYKWCWNLSNKIMSSEETAEYCAKYFLSFIEKNITHTG